MPKIAILNLNVFTVCAKRNAHLIPNFFVATQGRGVKNSHGYIIDHVNFWSPTPRGATKKFGIKCVFLLTQTVMMYSNLDMCKIYALYDMCTRYITFVCLF